MRKRWSSLRFNLNHFTEWKTPTLLVLQVHELNWFSDRYKLSSANELLIILLSKQEKILFSLKFWLWFWRKTWFFSLVLKQIFRMSFNETGGVWNACCCIKNNEAKLCAIGYQIWLVQTIKSWWNVWLSFFAPSVEDQIGLFPVHYLKRKTNAIILNMQGSKMIWISFPTKQHHCMSEKEWFHLHLNKSTLLCFDSKEEEIENNSTWPCFLLFPMQFSSFWQCCFIVWVSKTINLISSIATERRMTHRNNGSLCVRSHHMHVTTFFWNLAFKMQKHAWIHCHWTKLASPKNAETFETRNQFQKMSLNWRIQISQNSHST